MEKKPSNNNSNGTQSASFLNHKEKMKRYNIDHKSAKITIMLCIFIDVLGYSMILPLLPSIAQGTYGANNFTIGILIASNAFTAFIFAPIWGRLSDKYGRKPFLITSQLGTLTAFLILGFSDSITLIFLSRILDGIFGGQIPIIRAYVIDITDKETRSSEVAKIGSAIAFGIIFGPAIGGLLGVINWRYPVFVACVLSVITILMTMKYLVESMPKQRRLDLRENKRQLEKLKKRTLLTKLIILQLIEVFLIIFAFIMINSSFPLVLNLRYGFNVAMIGIIASVFGILMIIIGFSLRPLIKKFGERKLLIFSIFLGMFTFSCYGFLYTAWLLYIIIIPYAFSHIIIRSIILTNLSKSVEEDQQGIVSGWAMNMQSIAQIIAPLTAYWYLEISIISIMGITLDSYFLIGITCAFSILILLILVFYDMKKHPELFLRKITDSKVIKI
jgi:DHA1 family tetracycline resistance protein-like MFS transporter